MGKMNITNQAEKAQPRKSDQEDHHHLQKRKCPPKSKRWSNEKAEGQTKGRNNRKNRRYMKKKMRIEKHLTNRVARKNKAKAGVKPKTTITKKALVKPKLAQQANNLNPKTKKVNKNPTLKAQKKATQKA
jgi:hypothetical protein